MRRKSTGRGSRQSQRGVLSGSTIGTNPSGVTMGEGGLDFGVGDGCIKISGGSIQWTGVSVAIDTGLTNIIAVLGSEGWLDSKVSPAAIDWEHNPTGLGLLGGVTIGLISGVSTSGASANATAGYGSSICWMAFGT